MADVQLQNGYTAVANELLEVVYAAKFTSTEFKVLLAIMRFTYGYSRKSAELSASFLSTATGIPKRSIERSVASLVGNRVIFSVPGGSRKDSKLLGVNKNYTQWDVENVLKTCSNTVETVLKKQTADSGDGSLKASTTDSGDGSSNTTADTGDGRTTDSGDGHLKQVKQIPTTISTITPLYPPTGEKTENGVQKTLPDVENFSGPFILLDDWKNEVLTDRLSGLTFGRDKWNELEEAMGTERLLGYYDRLRDGYLKRGWKFKADILTIIERWYRKDFENE